ncbi:methyltransferase [Streptomyces eurythermus]|uniref:methyltransferase n=2 Tax=Streptomyces eurythermus TaxID=42237 RepID=UPI0036D3A2C9
MSPTPAEQMMRLTSDAGPWIFQSVAVAARLGIADHLGEEPVPLTELARRTGADADALYRFCRALDALGVLREHAGRTFSITPMGAVLKSDAPGTIRWSLEMLGGPVFKAFADSDHSVRTGEPAFDHVFGKPYHQFIAEDEDANRIFSAAMGGDLPPAVIDEFDLSGARKIVDLGGGRGTLLAHLLRRYPEADGVLQELPSIAHTGREYLAAQGLLDRCEVFGADFLDQVAPDGDVYLLSRTIQVLTDDEADKLLLGLRRAMRPGSRLVMMNRVLPEEPGFHVSKLTDLVMLVVYGGRERTVPELTGLLRRNGFDVLRTIAKQPPAGAKPDPRTAETAFEAVPAA